MGHDAFPGPGSYGSRSDNDHRRVDLSGDRTKLSDHAMSCDDNDSRQVEFLSLIWFAVQACGDCHLANFGGFATPERALVFDINDFDETFPGPWEWDVKRLGASLVLAARDRSFSKSIADEAVRAAAASYRERMAEFAEMTVLETWYARVTIDALKEHFRKDGDMSTRLSAKQKQARSRNSEAVFPKLTAVVDGRTRIKDEPPIIYHFHEFAPDFENQRLKFTEEYKQSLQLDRRKLYERYRFQDAAIKVVGVGSVGTRCYLSLLLADDDDPLFLQFKEARRSVLEPPGRKSRYANQGYRVVEGIHVMQAASDIFLGWSHTKGHDYYVRQFRDMKVSAEVETFRAEHAGWLRHHVRLGAGTSSCEGWRCRDDRRIPGIDRPVRRRTGEILQSVR